MKTRQEFFDYYLPCHPAAHALWRSFECECFAREKLNHPVLDLGCGDGFFAQAVFGPVLDVGVDGNAAEVGQARKRGAHQTVLLASATELPFRAGKFQTVICNSVLEHIPDLDRALAETSRVLASGGRLLLTVPSERYNQDSYFQKFFSQLGLRRFAQAYIRTLNRIFRHYHVNGRETWEQRLAGAGFEVVRVDYIISRPAFHTYEKWLIFAAPAKITKWIFGRWIFSPRRCAPSLLKKSFAQALAARDDRGVAYFIIAVKK
ncbi:MAG TPA: class I SAM-dependent methyltransferase [Opitutales bacterium]|jgi:ubiquinone/menaquinone biosynthesis C-methylase UbiE|nr:class I SAM-dependent methyltransferase [Opitutales bacterium]